MQEYGYFTNALFSVSPHEKVFLFLRQQNQMDLGQSMVMHASDRLSAYPEDRGLGPNARI